MQMATLEAENAAMSLTIQRIQAKNEELQRLLQNKMPYAKMVIDERDAALRELQCAGKSIPNVLDGPRVSAKFPPQLDVAEPA